MVVESREMISQYSSVKAELIERLCDWYWGDIDAQTNPSNVKLNGPSSLLSDCNQAMITNYYCGCRIQAKTPFETWSCCISWNVKHIVSSMVHKLSRTALQATGESDIPGSTTSLMWYFHGIEWISIDTYKNQRYVLPPGAASCTSFKCLACSSMALKLVLRTSPLRSA